MSKTTPPKEAPIAKLQKLVGRLITSRPAGWVANLPPIAWATRVVARTWAKREIGKVPAQEAQIERVAGIGLEATLYQIVYDVVNTLGYFGAGVATYEPDDSLPLRAFYYDPNIVSEEQVHEWETQISKIMGKPFSLSDPDIARVYVHQDEYQDNLAVRAVKARGPVQSDEYYDTCTPVVPLSAKPIVEGVQKALGIEQVISFPFFLETVVDGQPTREIVGNLFAVKRGKISEQDVLILSAFGRQASTAIESERRRLQIQLTQELVFAMQTSLQDETQVLQRIVRGVTSDLGYMGAGVATYEPDGSLPLRVFYLDPNIVSEEQVHEWEAQVSEIMGKPFSISDPDATRVYVHQDEFKDNLTVQALKAGKPVQTDKLYNLFRPVVPLSAKPIIDGIQEAVGVGQLIAIPFFLETFVDGKPTREIVGHLFTGTRSRSFSSGEIELLKAFGQQAAAGIRNARLYRKAEERRQAAEIFGRMAFTAAASVHALRNHIGAFRAHLQLMQYMSQLPAERRHEILDRGPKILDRLNEAADILENLHEPWRETPDVLTDINACLTRAIDKVILDRDETEAREGIVVHESLLEGLLSIKTSPDMLTETFKVMVKNAVEAIREKGGGGDLWIESRLDDDAVAEVLIRDNGIGIEPENLSKVFEMRWSTKKAGMGFGLFWTKDYIEGLGGSIKVESVWQKGTTFRISLPASVGRTDVLPSQVDTQKKV
jgi:signal transduction histidine kinase